MRILRIAYSCFLLWKEMHQDTFLTSLLKNRILVVICSHVLVFIVWDQKLSENHIFSKLPLLLGTISEIEARVRIQITFKKSRNGSSHWVFANQSIWGVLEGAVKSWPMTSTPTHWASRHLGVRSIDLLLFIGEWGRTNLRLGWQYRLSEHVINSIRQLKKHKVFGTVLGRLYQH